MLYNLFSNFGNIWKIVFDLSTSSALIEYEENYNMMKELLEKDHISHNIFSIYTSMKPGNSSHIIFGGIDEQGIQPNQTMEIVRTFNSTAWLLPSEKFQIGEQSTQMSITAVELNPAFPYIFVPKEDM